MGNATLIWRKSGEALIEINIAARPSDSLHDRIGNAFVQPIHVAKEES
jgi:hypothetical protein